MKHNSRKAALVSFMPGGSHVDFLPYGNVTRSCLSGYDSPENFFHRNDGKEFEGIPYLITRHLEGTPALIEGGISSSMLDVGLPAGYMRPCLGEARPLEPGEIPGALDYIALDLYLAMWKRLGGITGVIRENQFIPDPA